MKNVTEISTENIWREAIIEQMAGRVSRESYEEAASRWGFTPISDREIQLADPGLHACLLVGDRKAVTGEMLARILASSSTALWDSIYAAASVSADPAFVAAVAFTENRRIGIGYSMTAADATDALAAGECVEALKSSEALWLREAVANQLP